MNLKEQILNFVRREGPVLPVQISRKFSSNTILAGAILSELVSNKLVKISYAKIGGSPVYYVSGQEEKLSKLYDFLPGKEKEAYNLLKEKKVLRDRECEPGIRVALRNLKDFAFPILFNNELFWKWYLISDEVANNLISELLSIKPKKVKEEIKQEIKKKSVIKEKRNLFFEEIKSYLLSNNLDLVEVKTIKKSEVNMIIKFKSALGDLKWFLYAKSKKRIDDSDLRLAYSKGQQIKFPVLFLGKGELTKKAKSYLEEINGFLMFRKI